MRLKITYNYFFKDIFFANPLLLDAVTFARFYFCNLRTPKIGFVSTIFYSKIIDLTNPLEKIYTNFRRNTRQEIALAEKMNMKFSIENDLIKFVSFYNSFAETKNRKKTSFKYLSQLGDNLIITKSYINDYQPLTMHVYILNNESKMCILWMSASLFRNSEKENQKMIGYANRFLHFKDIEYFKNSYYQIYDLGGYAVDADEGSEQYGINYFKDQFGGQLVQYSNYTSSILVFILKIKSYLSKTIKLTMKK
jgi:lipid II:glycine glycyltransferase (peptidoglycan interpeptide bridge formation enzyme)